MFAEIFGGEGDCEEELFCVLGDNKGESVMDDVNHWKSQEVDAMKDVKNPTTVFLLFWSSLCGSAVFCFPRAYL